jgi:formylglycine-generating enzyme required for sulfatase activity
MKPQFAKSIPFLFALGLATWPLTPRASAQTPAGLDLRLYAGLSITGAVATIYSIEYVTDLAQTNTWRCLEFLKLPNSPSPYLWNDRSAPASGRRFYRAVQFNAPTNMVFIPPGTFRMGSPTNEVGRNPGAEGDEGPQTMVTISRGFFMGKFEVMQGEAQAIMGSNPSHFTGDPTLPVDQVNWIYAHGYCNQLTQQERAAGRIPTNCVYRLPTEAEWEYACRAGTSDRRFSYGDDPGYFNLTNYAWYSVNSEGTTHSVGLKDANQWGLYDMHGNVKEWVEDYLGLYSGGSVTDPTGPSTAWKYMVRGGSWNADGPFCRSACRGVLSTSPILTDNYVGFRLVLAPGQP